MVRGGQVFETSPGLGVIGERNCGALAVAVIADHQRGFVVQHIGALHGFVIVELPFVVVPPDGLQRLANVGRIDEGTQSGDVGEILADQLIEQAAIANLELGLLGIVRAHVADRGGRDLVLGNAADLLDVVMRR